METISVARAKEMEKARPKAETTMRANFKALLSNAGKDKIAIKKIAGEQAGFSSEREMLCRDYANETVNGFCALRITEARAASLAARLAGASGTVHAEVKPKKKPKPKPAAVASPIMDDPPLQ